MCVELVAQVRGVDAPGRRGDLREAHHLPRVRGQGIGVGQARAQADGAAGHAAFQVLLHGEALARRGDAGQVADVADPQRRVTGQGRDVHRGPGGPDGVDVLGEVFEGEVIPAAQEVERLGRPAVQANRRGADAAVAHHHRRDALADLRQAVGGSEDRVVVVGVHVDEPRGQRAAGEVVGLVRGGAAQVADGGDTVAPHADVGHAGCGARAVEDRRPGEQDVERIRRHGSLESRMVALVHAPSTWIRVQGTRRCGRTHSR